jgi:hypothetical protein
MHKKKPAYQSDGGWALEAYVDEIINLINESADCFDAEFATAPDQLEYLRHFEEALATRLSRYTSRGIKKIRIKANSSH